MHHMFSFVGPSHVCLSSRYGGHIVNDFDRLLANEYLDWYMKDELLDETELYPFAEDEKGVSFMVRLRYHPSFRIYVESFSVPYCAVHVESLPLKCSRLPTLKEVRASLKLLRVCSGIVSR